MQVTSLLLPGGSVRTEKPVLNQVQGTALQTVRAFYREPKLKNEIYTIDIKSGS